MRRSALAFLFCLISSIANAQTVTLQKPVICMPTQQLVDELKQKYNETAILIGEHDMIENVVTAVYANLEASTYTVIEVNKTIGCVLSVGKHLKFNVSEPLKSKNNV
jgi:hypothetical protein